MNHSQELYLDNLNFRRTGLFVLGVTGGIASGKSCAVSILKERLGCFHLDADQICRELLETGEVGWFCLKKEFGKRFIDGELINREKLRQELFSDEGIRNRINSLLHPLVADEISVRLDQYVLVGKGLVFIEIPLLYEAGWERAFDKIVFIKARRANQIIRLMHRDFSSRLEAEKAIQAQWTQEKKADLADYVIENDGSPVDMRTELLALAESLLFEFEQQQKKT